MRWSSIRTPQAGGAPSQLIATAGSGSRTSTARQTFGTRSIDERGASVSFPVLSSANGFGCDDKDLTHALDRPADFGEVLRTRLFALRHGASLADQLIHAHYVIAYVVEI